MNHPNNTQRVKNVISFIEKLTVPSGKGEGKKNKFEGLVGVPKIKGGKK